MRNEGQVHELIASLNPHYAVRPSEWTAMPGFEDADSDAYAFIVGSAFKFKPRTLDVLAQQMSPLAIGLLFWGAAEMKRARRLLLEVNSPKPSSASERAEQARCADDGNPHCDDNR
jgi:hypothetical protein